MHSRHANPKTRVVLVTYHMLSEISNKQQWFAELNKQ